MNTAKFIVLVRTMRTAQVRYFKEGRQYKDLQAAKKLEALVDAQIKFHLVPLTEEIRQIIMPMEYPNPEDEQLTLPTEPNDE